MYEDDDNRSTWDKVKDWAMGSSALQKAASTGASGGNTPGSTQNTLQGSDPTYSMKQRMEDAQDNANRQMAAEKQARSTNTTSKPQPSRTPITVQKKGAKSPPPSPQDILAAPQGKK